MEKPLVLGIDIGGSHITAALVDMKTRSILSDSYKRRFVNSGDDAATILNSWTMVIKEAFNGTHIPDKKISIAIPGPFDYVNGICLIKEQEKFQSLFNLNIRNELASRLNIVPSNIEFINDAAAFLKGEIFGGEVKITGNVMGITLGTGLGSALSINHVTTDAALWKSAFLDGIAEDYLSGRWFTERFKELTGKNIAGVKELLAGINEEQDIAQIFGEFGKNLARFMIPLINRYSLEMIVIGGSISLAYDLFSAELNSVLDKQQSPTLIKLSVLKENAALFGAASCFEKNIH